MIRPREDTPRDVPVGGGCGIAPPLTGPLPLPGAVTGPAASPVPDQSRARFRGRPDGWTIETDLRSAHGASTSGDFVVTGAPEPGRLGILLVDVSGSGPVAGARARLLARAFAPLLDTVPGELFLAAANGHVNRCNDDEGFATALLVDLDLLTGRFTLFGAGHPPAVHYRSGGRRWTVLADPEQGPALGLLADPVFPGRAGRLDPGDALLLYTDGLVESRRMDVERGISRLVRRARSVVPRHPIGAATRIATAMRAEDGDDRALIMIRRHPA